MSNRALSYAEDKLGVHAVHESALKAQKELDEVLTELANLADKRRQLADLLADREADLVIDERGKHSDMAVTRFEEHIKTAKRKSNELISLRDQLRDLANQISGLEYDKEMANSTIRICSARMIELGGYFQYLTALKEAETADKTIKAMQAEEAKTANTA